MTHLTTVTAVPGALDDVVVFVTPTVSEKIGLGARRGNTTCDKYRPPTCRRHRNNYHHCDPSNEKAPAERKHRGLPGTAPFFVVESSRLRCCILRTRQVETKGEKSETQFA